MLTVACVLKSGGDFDEEYVKLLAEGVRKHLRLPYAFVCLTDMKKEIMELGIIALPLRNNWPGWWSKMELYTLPGPVLYLDLDSCIVGDIVALASHVVSMDHNSFLMLRSFYRNDACGGILGWNGDWTWILHEFSSALENSGKFIQRGDHFAFNSRMGRFRSDQELLRRLLNKPAKKIVMAQDIIKGIYSYKVHLRPRQDVPEDANIICFHGKPRPRDINSGVFKFAGLHGGS